MFAEHFIYLSYDINIILKYHFCRKPLQFCHYVNNVVIDVLTVDLGPELQCLLKLSRLLRT